MAPDPAVALTSDPSSDLTSHTKKKMNWVFFSRATQVCRRERGNSVQGTNPLLSKTPSLSLSQILSMDLGRHFTVALNATLCQCKMENTVDLGGALDTFE